VAKIEHHHVIEAEKLSWSTTEISNAWVDLNMLPIQGIPSQPWTVKDVMATFGLVLEWLRGEVSVYEPDA
jgi:hypothetical protein